jgi:DNA-directed RNA polymerase beta' subunit
MDMIKSGSKGANKNVTQMAGCLAQQIVEGHLPL